jgi:catalase
LSFAQHRGRFSTAQVFVRGQYPVIGRFNIAYGDPHASYAAAPVGGFGFRIASPDGRE